MSDLSLLPRLLKLREIVVALSTKSPLWYTPTITRSPRTLEASFALVFLDLQSQSYRASTSFSPIRNPIYVALYVCMYVGTIYDDRKELKSERERKRERGEFNFKLAVLTVSLMFRENGKVCLAHSSSLNFFFFLSFLFLQLFTILLSFRSFYTKTIFSCFSSFFFFELLYLWKSLSRDRVKQQFYSFSVSLNISINFISRYSHFVYFLLL